MPLKRIDCIQFIKIKKRNGQEFIKLINKLFKKNMIIDQKSKIMYENEFILFPLIQDNDLIDNLINSIKNKFEYELIFKKGISSIKYKSKSLKDALKKEILEKYFELFPNSYDIIGDIAIIEFDKSKSFINEEIILIKKRIAKAMINLNKKIKSIYEKKSEIRGKYRLRDLKLLYGENKSETIHKENHCSFKVDVKRTFFTPRFVYERRRVASSNINENEIIIDLFAGVGTFSIQIAKNHNVKIYAFDLNPLAFYYMNENIKLNKLKGEILSYNLDVKRLIKPSNDIGKFLKNNADRIIMNLPEKSIYFIDVVCYLMKKTGGILHFYKFCEKPNPVEKAIKNLKNGLSQFNWVVEDVIRSKIVKAYSPKSDLVVVDLMIKSIDQ